MIPADKIAGSQRASAMPTELSENESGRAVEISRNVDSAPDRDVGPGSFYRATEAQRSTFSHSNGLPHRSGLVVDARPHIRACDRYGRIRKEAQCGTCHRAFQCRSGLRISGELVCKA